MTLEPHQIHPDHVGEHPDCWAADYEGTELTYWDGPDPARAWCDDFARSEAGDYGWDWIPDPDTEGEQQVWTRRFDDAIVADAPGRIYPLAASEG
jgi:hypothetical protein